jgi:hypothetical protein
VFRATFLGHQGWFLSNGPTSVLVDPIVEADFGCTPRARFEVLPRRAFNWSALPPIDAVFLTHEHEDHFDVRSLNRLARTVPLHLSDRSSDAAFGILAEMGFDARGWTPGAAVAVGGLRVVGFAGDHVAHDDLEEWDTLGFMALDDLGGGTFFTNVDVGVSVGMVRAVGELAAQYARAHPGAGLPPPGRSLIYRDEALFFGALREGAAAGRAPSYLRDPAAAERALRGGGLAPLPGQTVVMGANEVAAVEPDAPFLRADAEATAPAHPAWFAMPADEPFAPLCGSSALAAADLRELDAHLQDLARSLYGSAFFRWLLSLDGARLPSPRRGLALRLLVDDGGAVRTWSYDPGACAFVEGPSGDDARASHLTGLTCWASDLLAVFRGESDVRALGLGHLRAWAAGRRPLDVFLGVLVVYFHPLRHPAQRLRLYRAMWDLVRGEPAWIRGPLTAPPR